MVHAQQSWWVSQTYEVCAWLRSNGFWARKLLDVGCGDGRWIPALEKHYPGIQYTGIDRLKEHIGQNQLNFPEHKWLWGDFTKSEFRPGDFDALLFGGTFNPKIEPEQHQIDIINKAIELQPNFIFILFDLACSGRPPKNYLKDKYRRVRSYEISRDSKNSHQYLKMWVYGRYMDAPVNGNGQH